MRTNIDGFWIRKQKGFYRINGSPTIRIELTTPIRIDPFSQKIFGPFLMAAWYVRKGAEEFGNGVRKNVPPKYTDKDTLIYLRETPGILKTIFIALMDNQNEVLSKRRADDKSTL